MRLSINKLSRSDRLLFFFFKKKKKNAGEMSRTFNNGVPVCVCVCVCVSVCVCTYEFFMSVFTALAVCLLFPVVDVCVFERCVCVCVCVCVCGGNEVIAVAGRGAAG